MGRALVLACLPWLGCLAISGLALALLLRAARARMDLRRLWQLHHDQVGSVQSLSFVLTFPVLVMIMLFIVQVSQLMIGTIVVHYAAFASARAAAVWVPAGMASGEGPNCISSYYADSTTVSQASWASGLSNGDSGPAEGGTWFVIRPGSPKHDKIASAAVLACMSISPSRDTGEGLSGRGPSAAQAIEQVYRSLAPASQANTTIPKRIRNKLAYAMASTQVEMRFYHPNSEPPLVTHSLEDGTGEFAPNEMGWQDQITVTVRHDLALLPGPGRLLAQRVAGPAGTKDTVSETIQRRGEVYTYPLSASATIGNEGEKPVISYVYPAY